MYVYGVTEKIIYAQFNSDIAKFYYLYVFARN